jgi:putative heme iron utilization protein
MAQMPEPDLEAIHLLWAGRFQGVLSTQSIAEPGYPFGSVAPYCLDGSGLPVFLFSHLAQHCRNLDADPRCAFTISEHTEGDVQQSLRLTCLGQCTPVPDGEAHVEHRYFRYYPQGRMYFEELGFRLYRLAPRRFHYNGGFATARWLGTDRILRPSYLAPSQERRLIERAEKQPRERLLALSSTRAGFNDRPRIAGIDPWGLDLAAAQGPMRIPFPNRLDSPAALEAKLENLL